MNLLIVLILSCQVQANWAGSFPARFQSRCFCRGSCRVAEDQPLQISVCVAIENHSIPGPQAVQAAFRQCSILALIHRRIRVYRQSLRGFRQFIAAQIHYQVTDQRPRVFPPADTRGLSGRHQKCSRPGRYSSRHSARRFGGALPSMCRLSHPRVGSRPYLQCSVPPYPKKGCNPRGQSRMAP